MQREVADWLGVCKSTLEGWERNLHRPGRRHIPAVVEFLGYAPFPEPASLGDRVLRYRRLNGISRWELAESSRRRDGALSAGGPRRLGILRHHFFPANHAPYKRTHCDAGWWRRRESNPMPPFSRNGGDARLSWSIRRRATSYILTRCPLESPGVLPSRGEIVESGGTGIPTHASGPSRGLAVFTKLSESRQG
jgi:hypothetical protein